MKPSDVPEGPLALDTDVFSMLHLRKGPHAQFAPLVQGHAAALPFCVVGELLVLPRRAQWGERTTDRLRADIRRCTVIPSDARIVDEWARLRARLFDRLQSGGINDLWTAACVLVHGIPLATNNLRDFQTIATEAPGLQLVHPDL